jgi:hypothetical protein
MLKRREECHTYLTHICRYQNNNHISRARGGETTKLIDLWGKELVYKAIMIRNYLYFVNLTLQYIKITKYI